MTRVLVIDDDTVILQLASMVLETGGYEVQTAAGSEAGLQAAATFKPEVIVLDVQMPGMDGYEVCRRLRQDDATARTPVIMFTTSKDYKLNQLAYAAGAQACLPKPFRREALVALVETVRVGMRKE